MSEEGYIYNIISKIQIAWAPEKSDLSSKTDNNSDPGKKDVDISPKDHSSKVSLESETSNNDETFSQKVTNIFSGYYNYYKSNDELKAASISSADNTSYMRNTTENQTNQKDPANASNALLSLFLKKNESSNDRTVPNDLLAEIKNAGGVIKLNKVIHVKEEKRTDHDLTAVLSSALNARKNVMIMDPEGN